MLGSPGLKLNNKEDVIQYLYSDLRLYPDKIEKINIKKLKQIALAYSNANIYSLINFLEGKL
jgi:hypothetical protein